MSRFRLDLQGLRGNQNSTPTTNNVVFSPTPIAPIFAPGPVGSGSGSGSLTNPRSKEPKEHKEPKEEHRTLSKQLQSTLSNTLLPPGTTRGCTSCGGAK